MAPPVPASLSVSQTLLCKRKSPLWKHQDSDEAADEVNSLPESQRMSNNDIVEAVEAAEAVDQDENITIVTIDSNSVIIDSVDKVTEVFEIESNTVTESEPENPEAPPKEEVTELLSGETISKLSIGCLQNSLLPVELLEENIEELSDEEDEIFEINRTLPRPEQVEVEADQEKDKLLTSEEIADDHINDSVEEEKHSKHSNDILEEEEDMEESPAPLPECDQHDEILDNQKDEDTENSNANDKVVLDKVDNENSESPGCNATILESKQVSYPEDLNPDPVKNPFGSDNDKEEDVKDDEVVEQQQKELDIKKESTNPFGSDDDDDEEEDEEGEVEPKKPEPEMKKESSNPFGSDSDSDDNVEEEFKQKPVSLQAPPPKPPRLSLNPFGSDFEDDDEGNEVVPEGKKHKQVAPSRKKRHAPPPPTLTSSPIPATRTSLLRSAPPRPPPLRPPPPLMTRSQKDEDNLSRRSQILEESISVEVPAPPAPPPTRGVEAEVGTTSVSAITPASCVVTVLTPMSPNKANLEGQWKKKKGPAPARPTPPKRQVKKLPRKAVNMELLDIEVKQLELERQGVDLEKTIREVCEKSDKEREEAGLDNNDRDSLGPRAEDLIVQLFELVNEKNELFRRQTELMYMKREHRLEEEHADIEHQVCTYFSRFRVIFSIKKA